MNKSTTNALITTAQLAAELGIQQRAIQNRILRLRIRPQRVGNSFALTERQAQAVRDYDVFKGSCLKCGASVTVVDKQTGECTQCHARLVSYR